MNKCVFTVLICLLLLAQAWAAKQWITIYEEKDQNGDSHTFTKKYANLPEWSSFLNKTQSFCLVGDWQFWDLPNYEVYSISFGHQGRTKTCINTSFTEFKSGRFLGPEDFDTPAIALFQGNRFFDFGGLEYVVTAVAENYIPFRPTWAFLYGNSSWTLFTGKNFDGNSTCFAPNLPPSYVYTSFERLNSSFFVQSVVQGCDTLQVTNNINQFKNNLN